MLISALHSKLEVHGIGEFDPDDMIAYLSVLNAFLNDTSSDR